MPRKPKIYSKEEQMIIDQFANNLQIGIPGPESSGNKNPYTAQNPTSSAAGKYQFLKEWLTNDYGITEYAKENGFGEVTNMEQFKADSSLQDSYFRYYAKNVLYPKSKELYNGTNPLNLTMEEIGGLGHFDGHGGARKQVVSGKLNPPAKKGVDGAKHDNMGRAAWLDVMNKTITKSGNSHISKSNLKKSGIGKGRSDEDIISDFDKRSDSIDNNDNLSVKEKEVQRKRLWEGIVKNGNRDVVNEHIEKVNAENKATYEEQINDYNELKDVVENLDYNYLAPNPKKGRGSREFKEKAWFKPFDKKDNEKIERLREKYDFMLVKDPKNKSKGAYLNHLNVSKLFKAFEDKHKALTGEDIKIKPGSKGAEIVEGETGLLTPNATANLLDIGQGDNRVGNLSLGNIKGVGSFTPKNTITKDFIPDPIPKSRKEEEKEIIDKKEDSKKTTPKEEAEKDTSNEGLASQFFKNELALNSLDNQDVNYTPGKRELPMDALVGMSLGLIGNEQAKNAEIPLRTEDVSEAMRNFTADLKQKSEEGLPVEVEAQMKSLLADAYQGGLENIVRASGGNRATVLGNLGQLEQAKNKGLVGIQVADYEAKDRAFAQYGKAIEYINDFDTRRDIANQGILYREGKEKQKAGQDLATAGFAKMIDGIKYDREHGPGSVYDMQRSAFMQNIFGFDPKAKDDGSGTEVGTKSWYDAGNAKATADKLKLEGLHERFQAMNPAQQAAYDKVVGHTQDSEVLEKSLSYIERGDVDPTKININRINQAIQNDDMGLLSKADPTKQTAIPTTSTQQAEAINITNPTQEPNITDPIGLTNITQPEQLPPLGLVNNSVEVPQPIEQEELGGGLLNFNTDQYTKQ